MTALDRGVIESRLQKMESVINLLEEIKEYDKSRFVRDEIINGAAMFNMVIGIEIIVDVGNHFLSQVFKKPEKTYRDVIATLGDKDVIPKDFAREHQNMPDFRNKLIHAYPDIDIEDVYLYVQKAPVVFREFTKYFEEFIDEQDAV